MEFLNTSPLLFRGGAARLGLAEQGLVAAGWGFAANAVLQTKAPTPNPSPEEEGGE
jgi:hypothetical protein